MLPELVRRPKRARQDSAPSLESINQSAGVHETVTFVPPKFLFPMISVRSRLLPDPCAPTTTSDLLSPDAKSTGSKCTDIWVSLTRFQSVKECRAEWRGDGGRCTIGHDEVARLGWRSKTYLSA